MSGYQVDPIALSMTSASLRSAEESATGAASAISEISAVDAGGSSDAVKAAVSALRALTDPIAAGLSATSDALKIASTRYLDNECSARDDILRILKEEP
ncbi:hypothetical protein DMC61_14650 [Amycolatopsis sp. WAC 04169]|uniref:hypothetical protein n=1 Tax=Amycolatopsis sp. WAC 04169 TaxID=2203197 RepID=UPI000F7784AC|nr:hypothetical protein [Amycolatopsis sp. WAC 04169]RSN31384.1 hypothetical protein DMC61_14650 [Amycolatopsis sp. WAC 04169]